MSDAFNIGYDELRHAVTILGNNNGANNGKPEVQEIRKNETGKLCGIQVRFQTEDLDRTRQTYISVPYSIHREVTIQSDREGIIFHSRIFWGRF